MNDTLAIALAAAAAIAAPTVLAFTYDAVAPIPPLPTEADHNAAWWAAWSSIYGAGALGTQRKRAVTLRELADEQIAQAGTPAHVDEALWLRAWIDAYRAGNDTDSDTFGPLQGAGTQYGGEGLAGGLGDDAVNTILNGDAPDVWGLSPLGNALTTIAKQWRRVAGDASPWMGTGNASDNSIGDSRAAIRTLAAAMDDAVMPAGFFGKAGHLAGSAASAVGTLVGDVASGAGKAVGDLLGGALGGLTQGLIPLVLVGGAAYLTWKAFA